MSPRRGPESTSPSLNRYSSSRSRSARLAALGGGADDRAGTLEVELGGLLAQSLALLLVEPPGHADALAVGRVDHVAAGDREVHRQARALGLQGVLDDLDDDLLAGLEQIGDVATVARAAAAAARRLDARQHDLVDVQEAVLLQADVDERRLQPGEDVVDPALVDVADDRAVAPALQIQLGDSIVAGRRLTTPARGAGGRGLARGGCPARLQHRHACLSAVDADQHLLLQLSSILWKACGQPAVAAPCIYEISARFLPDAARRPWM